MGYPGGKNGAGVYQAIINQMPPHDVYIEPFLGGAAVMRLKRPAALNIGLDRSAAAIAAARSCLAGSGDSAGWIDETGGVGQPRRKRRGDPDLELGSTDLAVLDPAAPPLMVGPAIARPADSAGGSSRTPTSTSAGFGGAYRRATPAAAVFDLRVGDALDFLARHRFEDHHVIYCDPPYLHETRSKRRLYEFEMTDADHRALLAVLQKVTAPVILSGYWSELYAQTLRGWRTATFQTVNRAGKPCTEWLWMNYPEPMALHDYAYLGTGYRERERIKKKLRRWTARLGSMPLLERRAMLAAIRAFTAASDAAAVQSTPPPEPSRAVTARNGAAGPPHLPV